MTEKKEPIDTATWPRSFEAACEIIIKLLGLYITYRLGSHFMETKQASETLFSILLLPALLVLKDAHILFEPFTIKTYISNNEVVVKSGYFTRKTDKLSIETLENIELVKTPMGWLKSPYWPSYGTLYLHAYGGSVTMPFLKKPEAVQKDIDEILNRIKQQNNIQDTNSKEH